MNAKHHETRSKHAQDHEERVAEYETRLDKLSQFNPRTPSAYGPKRRRYDPDAKAPAHFAQHDDDWTGPTLHEPD